MGGGLLQIVALGAQDAYISGNPQITFWKGLYKRHTNFAMEACRINFTGVAKWGNQQSVVVNRYADLMYSTYLEVILPSYDPVQNPTAVYNNEQFRLGYNLLRYIELEIGGQVIDRLYGEFLFLWDTMTATAEQNVMLQQMLSGAGRPLAFNYAANALVATNGPATSINKNGLSAGVAIDVGSGITGTGGTGSTSGQTAFPGQVIAFADPTTCTQSAGNNPGSPNVIYVPIRFFYTRNPGSALPLVALQYHEVKINIHWHSGQMVSGDYVNIPSPANPTSASIYIDYIYLDTDERRRLAQESHQYLIEQVQYNENKGLSSYKNRIDLTFNHPVKELIWVVQPTCYRNCKVAIPGTSGANVVVPKNDIGVRYSNVGGSNLYANTNRLTPFTYDQTAVYKAHLQFNGTDRFDARYGDYFNKVQAWQHHTGAYATTYVNYGVGTTSTNTPGNPAGYQSSYTTPLQGGATTSNQQLGIYSYSFALKPEEHQPSGTCNFSRLETATLVLTLSGDIVINPNTDQTWDVRVYAINYNILNIMSGMSGLLYSN